MSDFTLWTSVSVLVPLLAALLTLAGGRRTILTGLAIGSSASLLGAGGLARAVHAHGVGRHLLGGWGRPLGIELYVDGLAVVFLSLAAVVGTAVSIYASVYFGDVSRRDEHRSPAGRGARYFAPLSLFLWSGLNGVFLTGDLFNLYVMLEIVGLSATALVTLAVSAKATEAGMRYLLVSLTGSMSLLFGVAILYIEYGTLSLEDLATMSPSGPVALTALAFMTTGLAAKTALFPLHTWLPPAHAAAPAPASALLSSLVVKASFYAIVRLWLFVYGVPVPGGGGVAALTLLGTLGGIAIVWGSLLALRQVSLKRLIAYSTVAQLGYLFVMFPLLPVPFGDTAGNAWSIGAWSGGIYHAVSHGLAKAAMFLAAGNMTYAVADDAIESISGVARRLPMSFLAFGIGGMSLAGIPPSAGFVAKWLLLSSALEHGRWGWAVVIAVGGLLTLAYVLRVARHAFAEATATERFRSVPARMEWTALTLALLAVLLGFRAVEILGLLLVGSEGPWS